MHNVRVYGTEKMWKTRSELHRVENESCQFVRVTLHGSGARILGAEVEGVSVIVERSVVIAAGWA